MAEIKKIEKFLQKLWKIRYLCAILTTLSALMCPDLTGAEVGKALPKPAWQLEKELAETEKKLAEVTNIKERLEAEVRTLRSENSLARRELIETIDKYSMLAGKLKRWNLSVAAVMETLRPHYTDVRAEDTAESLRTVMQSSVALASASGNLCSELDKILMQKMISDPVSAAKLRILINSTSAEIRKIAILNSPAAPPRGFEKCRILNTLFSLNAVSVSAGYRNGVRHGMLLYTPDGKNVVKIVAVKNFVSAGVVSRGDIRKLGIGMELRVRKALEK